MTDEISNVWPNYLQGGYFDDDRILKPEYVSRGKVEPLIESMANAPDKNLSSNQLRRFFQHCRAIEARLKSGSNWNAEHAQFLKLDVFAAYAYDQKDRKIPALFYEFLQRNVAAVKSKEDFLDGFLPHFEALVGFGSLYLKPEKK